MAFIHFAMGMSYEQMESNWLGWLTNELDGRPATVFMILAGMGISLRLRGEVTDQRLRSVQSTLRRRGWFFLLIGYLNLVWWQGDILRVYGIGFLVVPMLLVAPVRRLWSAVAATVIVFVGMMFLLDYEQNWDWETLHYENLWTLSGGARELFFNGFRSVFPWLAFMFLGMLIGRTDLRSKSWLWKLSGIGMLVWGLATASSYWLVECLRANATDLDEETIIALVGTTSMPPLPLFLLAAGGAAVLFIGVCIYVVDMRQNQELFQPLVAAGQMAFTWYMAHIGLSLALEHWYDGTAPPATTGAVSAMFVLVMVLSSHLYKRKYQIGPLEKLLRMVSG